MGKNKKFYVAPLLEVDDFFVREAVLVNTSDLDTSVPGQEGIKKPGESAGDGTGFDANKKGFGSGNIWD